jgi:hypothetical protein
MRGKIENSVRNGKESRVCVRFGGESHVAVAHDFHRHARRCASSGEVRCQSMAQRMEVSPKSLGVDKFNASRFQIGPEAIHVRHEVSEDSLLACGQLSNKQSDFVFHVGVQSNNGLLMILGRRSADIDKRLRRLKVNVIPLQLRKLAAAKPGQSRRQIKNLPRACGADKTAHFVIRECPTGTYLLAVGLDLLNMLQRIFGNALVFFHPTQKGRDRAEILVECFGRSVLLRPPCLERIGGNIAKQFPAAVMDQFADSVFQFVDVLNISIQGAQIGNILHQMTLKRGLCCVSYCFRRNHACLFHLFVAHDLL